MKTFKTLHDLQQLQKSKTQRELRRGLKREGHIEGYFVLIEAGDTTINLPELQADIRTLSFDGVFKAHGHYHAIYLTNNSFGLEFVIPDSEWLDGDIKANLQRHLP